MDERLYRYVGNTDQLYGVRRYAAEEGRLKGASVYRAYTSAGLEFDVLPDSGMDIGPLKYKGVNISFMSKNGQVAAFYPTEDEFLRTFPAGMLYTCGLLSTGNACREGDTWHPLHGRLRGSGAEHERGYIEDGRLILAGEIRETQLFGHNLRLERRIEAPVDGTELEITDRISNCGPKDEPYMVLYHMNFGYPFLSPECRLILPKDTRTEGRTPKAAAHIGACREFSDPIDGEEEECFFHNIPAREGMAAAVLENRELGIGCELQYSKDTLPVLVQWKSMASGDYALGLEPSNSRIRGRVPELESGDIRVLPGFGSVQTRVCLRFYDI